MAAAGILSIKYLQRMAQAGGLLLWALLAVWLGSLAETLEVNIFTNPKEVLVKEDVSLKCRFTVGGAIDLTNVGVQWAFGPENKEIYVFNGGEHSPKRQGAKMSDADLRKGDASLYLPNIQFDEEGEYTCTVFVTPDKVEKRSAMQVSAAPVIYLSTEHITILTGSEGSVKCDVTGFYPPQHELFWEKIANGKTENLTEEVCTGALTSNSDGTFNVSSRVRIKPTLDDDGNWYRCIMNHRSCFNNSKEAQLTVNEHKETSAAGSVVGSVFATLLLCGVLCFCIYLYCLKFKKVSPKISEFSKPSIIRHFEEAIFSCQVTGFRPKEITIILFLKRKGDESKKKIFDSHYPDQITQSKVKPDEVQLLINGNEEDTSFKCMEPVFEANSDGTSNIKCNIKMYPDVFKDDGAELILGVYHKTLLQLATKTVILNVKGVPPKISNIVAPPYINQNELVALTCSINGFKPRPLIIIWEQSKKNNERKEIIRLDESNRTIFSNENGKKSKYNHYISELQYEDKTYSITSVLVIIPDILQDQDTQYICKVHHECTGIQQQKEITLKVKAIPKLDTITCGTEKAVAGETMTLNCPIHSFYPSEITVTWLKNGEKMAEEPEVNEPTLGNDGLYYLTSSVKSVPTRADVGNKYMCQVEHESLIEPLQVDWVLQRLVSVPKVTEVTTDPLYPEVGKPVTLYCKAYGFYPEDNQIFWFRGFDKTKDGVETDEVELDETTGLYSRLSKRTFIPTYIDHGKELKMQILHSETSNKPISSVHFLKIKGIPFVEDIKLDPPEAVYGAKQAFICNVANFYPHNINTTWQQKGKEICKGITVKEPVKDESGCYRMSSRLQVTPTALDFDQEFSFHVIHDKLKIPIIKQAFLTLSALSPNLSVIKADPELPGVNQPISLSISLTSYAPAEVQIKWFKNGTPCSVNNSPPVIADDGLFSSVTSTQFTTTENDHESSIRCEVLHVETKEIQEKNFKLLLQGSADHTDYENIPEGDDDQEVSEITCQTENPKAGQPVTVSCTVKGYTIEDTHITWYRGVYPCDDMRCIKNSPFKTGIGFTTALTFTPRQEDDNCQFQVDIITEMDPISKYFNLKLS